MFEATIFSSEENACNEMVLAYYYNALQVSKCLQENVASYVSGITMFALFLF
jgi:hypothetical protein